ncbi:DENN domain-containing protein 2B-like isoform X2 [Daktulosphaira vitifoliae]|uniref:DENN domain-containing protein 2B-like isoform X1 n=1 Tax=Daktulosphaira vitifoliae TaxID=58002 RepID=UPI0021AAC0AF|nr:DENN domain-containing protein 2B-like isoform X1 [Daktulosphaira vitifoliae]XP_050542768.1 DENN domain-containing protein 2B-like isoform X2 [Daktulosphaira vitifoliae]
MNNENNTTVDLLKKRFESFQCGKKSSPELLDSQNVIKRNIKRTPAFRRDFKLSKQTGETPYFNKVTNIKKNNHSTCIYSKSIETFITPTSNFNQFKSQTKKVSDLNNCTVDKTVTSNHEVLIQCLKKELNKNNTSNTITVKPRKNSLETFLPIGPPPKKPPRTFAHDKQLQINLNSKIEMDFHEKQKSDPKVMLEKLEKFVVDNSQSKQKINIDEQYTVNSLNSKKIEKKTNLLTLAKSLGCISNQNMYDNNTTKDCDTDDQNYLTTKFYCENSIEHIYDEPIFLMQNSNKNSANSCHVHTNNKLIDDSDKSDLHYMSTSIQDLDFKNYIENFKSLSSLDIDSVDGISKSKNFSNDSESSHERKIQLLMNEAYGTFIDARECENDTLSFSYHKDNDSNFTSGKNVNEQTLERKGYLRRVAKKVSSTYSTLVQDKNHLFHALLLVGLDLSSTKEKLPYIKYKYPDNVKVPKQIENLCFPDAHVWPFTADDCRTYTLTVTDENGRRYYGYCYRVQPEEASYCLPLVYCIYSMIKANSFYFQVLREIESRHGLSEFNIKEFIQLLYNQTFPELGSTIFIPQNCTNSISFLSEQTREIRRPFDIRQEQNDLLKLLQVIKPSTFIQMLASMLLERKLILFSKSISLLSSSIDGLTAALYPFTWQHTLISVLPSQMVSITDFVQAPTPFIVGIIKSDIQLDILAQFSENDQVFIFDLDTNKILRKVKDEYSVIPSRIAKGLKNVMSLKVELQHSTKAILASESLIRLFVELVGHFRMFILPSSQNKKFHFQKQPFIDAGSNTAHQNFLEWFTETAMFTTFINNRLNCEIDNKDVFERRCEEFTLELNKIKQKSKTLQTVKAIGDRIKEWTVL